MAHSSPRSYPAELVARCLDGPPVVIQFVDDFGSAQPLSILVVQHEHDLYPPVLPFYDVDGEPQAAEAELPRFALFDDDADDVSHVAPQHPSIPNESPVPLVNRTRVRRSWIAGAAAAAAVFVILCVAGAASWEASNGEDSAAVAVR